MRIEENNGKYILQEETFPSIEKLVQYYGKHEIPNEEKIRHIRLLYPITNEEHNAKRNSSRRVSDGQVPAPSAAFSGPSRVLPRTTSVPSKMSLSDTKFNNKKRISSQMSAKRPPPPLPREVVITPVPANKQGPTPPPEYCYDYAKTTDHLDEVRESVRLMDLADAGELCECGLLISESKLPLGWTIHRSTEPATRGRVFFVSPNQQSAWNLPSDVDKLLTGEQRLFIEGLRQKSP